MSCSKHLLVQVRSDKSDSGFRRICAHPGCNYEEPKNVGNDEKGNE